MTEIEPGAVRYNNAPPLPLRGTTSAADLLAGSSVSLDAFSEVFARMAEPSSPPPPKPAPKPAAQSREEDDVEETVSERPEIKERHEAAIPETTSRTDEEPVLVNSAPESRTSKADETPATPAVETDVESDVESETTVESEPIVAEQIGVQDGVKIESEGENAVVAVNVVETPTDAVVVDTADQDVKAAKTTEPNEAIPTIPNNERGSTEPSTFSTETTEVGGTTHSDSSGEDSGDQHQPRDDRGRDRFATPNEGRFSDPQSSTDSAAPGTAIENSLEHSPTEPAASVTEIAESAAPTTAKPVSTASETPATQQAATPPEAAAVTSQTSTPSATDAPTVRQSNAGTSDPGQIATEMRLNGTAEMKAKAAGDTSSVSEVANRVKLLQRVSKAFQHVGPNGGNIRIRLAPEELGTVRIEMQVQDQQIRARVVAETEAAGHVLRENINDLKNRLESQGLSVEQIDVETDSSDSTFTRFGHSDHHEGQGRGPRDGAPRHSRQTESEEANPQLPQATAHLDQSRRAAALGRVDLVL